MQIIHLYSFACKIFCKEFGLIIRLNFLCFALLCELLLSHQRYFSLAPSTKSSEPRDEWQEPQSHSRHRVVRSSLNSAASDYTIVRNQVSTAWKERKEGLGGGGQGASEGEPDKSGDRD